MKSIVISLISRLSRVQIFDWGKVQAIAEEGNAQAHGAKNRGKHSDPHTAGTGASEMGLESATDDAL